MKSGFGKVAPPLGWEGIDFRNIKRTTMIMDATGRSRVLEGGNSGLVIYETMIFPHRSQFMHAH